MKSKVVFLFLFLIIMFTSSVYSNSFFNYKRFGGTWYDANKTLSNTLDDPFCTTAAASNVLKYAGWDPGFTNSDAIFAEFLNLWAASDISLTVINSWALWLNGRYIHWINWPVDYEWLTDISGRGNFYPNNPFEDYYYTETNQSNVLSAAANFLRNGYGVTLTIQVGGDIMQHTVTLWGYDYDAQGNYLGIWITDSDDYYPDPDNPQPKLSFYKVHYDQSDYKWWIDGYQIATCPWWGTNFYIQSVRALDRNPATFFPVAFFDDFSEDKGWVGLGPGGWERRPAAAGGGENGYPGPTMDYSGLGDNYILGFAIGGDYPNNMKEESITSPPIDCTRHDQVFLKFRRYLNVEGTQPEPNVEGDHVKIHISNDAINWTQVWENPPIDLTDNQWVPAVFDISSVAANQPTVYIKFTMGPTNSTRRFSSWNIDDVEVTSEAIYPSEGTVGTELEITGSNFGTKKGKVLVGNTVLKVLQWGDEFIKGGLTKPIDLGVYDVIIQPSEPKGAAAIVKEDAFVVRPPEIYSLDRSSGTADDQITIKGKFFGTKRGKVYLDCEQNGVEVRKNCKIMNWTMDPTTADSQILFAVPKMLPEVCDVVVDPYGAISETEEEEGFTVKAPEIASIYPSSGSAGEQITIHGYFFGTKRGKVYLGYKVNVKPTKKSCAVVRWTVNPVTEEGDIVFVVPKGLAAGPYDLVVTNSVGSNTIVGGIILK